MAQAAAGGSLENLNQADRVREGLRERLGKDDVGHDGAELDGVCDGVSV